MTSYFNDGRTGTSYIIADSMDMAERLRRERNIGERITSNVVKIDVMPDYKDLTNEEFVKQLPEIMEQAIFLSYLCFASGQLKLERVLGINSLADQLRKAGSVGTVTEIIELARKELYTFQMLAPGVFPVERAKQITVKLEPGERKTVRNIVQGATVNNLGPAALTICDCDTDPDCTISDTDEPCGYHQTIEAQAIGRLDTNKDFVHVVNRDTKLESRVQLLVKEKYR